MRRALEGEFVREMVELLHAASGKGVLETFARVRALIEIAGRLSTEELLNLAAQIEGRDDEDVVRP